MIHRSTDGYHVQSHNYAAARPTYEGGLIDRLVARLGRDRWVDLGAGTGISTAALVDRGVDVLAVEPVEAMRERFAEALPGVEVCDGTATSIPVPDASRSVVLAATAFHWFDHGPTLDEIARVLEPAGSLVTLWNTRDDSIPWMARYTEIGNRRAGDTPRYKTMHWRRAIEGDPRFELAHEERVPNPLPTTPDAVVARMLSTSFIGALDDDGRAEVEAEVRHAVAGLGPSFGFAYVTEVQVWRFVGSDT